MKEIIGFAFLTIAIGCAAFAEAGSGPSKQDVVRPKVELAAPAASHKLPFEVLKPVY
jgi:hypothetical protein